MMFKTECKAKQRLLIINLSKSNAASNKRYARYAVVTLAPLDVTFRYASLRPM